MYYDKRQIITSSQKLEYANLLKLEELDFEEVEYSVGLYDDNILVGAMSLDNNCIKMATTKNSYAGEGVAATLVSDIIKYAYEKGLDNIFVYTKVNNEYLFNNLGFSTIVKTSNIVFLESKLHGIDIYCKQLSLLQKSGNIASLVMNLNPITLGHLYLIEYACTNYDYVHLFIVKEDKSVFKYEVRLELLQKATKEFNNLIIHPGSDYIISSATFPTYFIKSKDEIPDIYAKLDAEIFAQHICKALNINARIVGTEPYSKTTNMYNNILKSVLSNYNVSVVEINRLEDMKKAISASTVRQLLKEERFDEIKDIVPITTYNYLISDDAKEIIAKLKKSDSRH